MAKGDLEGLILRLAPIASRVRNYTDDHATVDIYFLRLWSFPSKGALDDYATVQLDLVWEQNNWRLDDSSLIDGPYQSPASLHGPSFASSAAKFESTLSGYDPVCRIDNPAAPHHAMDDTGRYSDPKGLCLAIKPSHRRPPPARDR